MNEQNQSCLRFGEANPQPTASLGMGGFKSSEGLNVTRPAPSERAQPAGSSRLLTLQPSSNPALLLHAAGGCAHGR